MPVANHRGIEIAIAINFRAADEAELHIASRHRTHHIQGRSRPEGTIDVGRVTHRIKQLRGWLIAYHAALEEASTVGRVRAFGKRKSDERQAHADEDVFAVAYLARRTDYHA